LRSTDARSVASLRGCGRLGEATLPGEIALGTARSTLDGAVTGGTACDQAATNSRTCETSRLLTGRHWLAETVATASVLPASVMNSTS